MKRAFTLIEVIITALVVALLAVSAYPSFTAVQHRQDRKADMGVLEGCFLEAKARAKAPSDQAVTTISLIYNSGQGNCEISEVKADDSSSIVNTTNLSGKSVYFMNFPHNTDGNLTGQAKITISTEPPYNTRYENGHDEVVIELRERSTSALLDTVTINAGFGVVNTSQ